MSIYRESTPTTAPPRSGSQTKVAPAHTDSRSALRPAALISIGLAGALGLAALASSTASAQEWDIQRVDEGTKPAITLTPDGNPVIIYMLERQDGWVRVASLVDDAWQIDEVANGYFYGPPDIAAGPDGVLHAAYHDHQAAQFQPDLGDATYLRGEDGVWTSTPATDPGHDGWDNRITVDSEGQPHMVGVDPLEFDGVGVEYYALNDDGSWTVEAIGSGPQTYKYAVSVVVDSAGVPWVIYHDGSTNTLNLAHPTADGWQIEVVDDQGETGFFNESAIDGDGGLHISYYERVGDTTGNVKYAYRADPSAEWQFSTVDALDAVATGFTGARNITAIDVDADGNPWILYSDESVMKLARQVDGEWQTEVVTEAGDVPLGQIVSLALDNEGRPHVAFADVTDKGQLAGNIWYATRS